jgi:hypothetical protein
VGLTFHEIERIRRQAGASVLLFITDRCPVGCAHCSVNSRRDSPTIHDYAEFRSLVTSLCDMPALKMVGISGGEPFTERRGLSYAVDRLAAAGINIVVYTSGIWGRSERTPSWIRKVLRSVSCVFLSTDAFHGARIDERTFVAAARGIVDEASPLVVQVLDRREMVDRAHHLLDVAFGEEWGDFAEVNVVPPLPYGRGASQFTRARPVAARTFGPCALVRAPVARYDGTVSACCNERVIMGLGPDRLRRQAEAGDVDAALAELRSDHLLRLIGTVGPGALTGLAEFSDLESEQFSSICDLCWQIVDRGSGSNLSRLADAAETLQVADHPGATLSAPKGIDGRGVLVDVARTEATPERDAD